MSNLVGTTEKTEPDKMRVTIRMYRPGLGDCFLIKFKKGPLTRYMLIDCGVLQKTQGEKERLEMIVKDIRRITRGRLHVLVATHEHADHLSGFIFHESLFREKFKIDQVWMSWLENKDDPGTKETYRQYWKIAAQTLDIAIEELKKKGKSYESYEEMQDFLIPGSMDTVKNFGKKQVYLAPEPGPNGPTKVMTLEGIEDVRVHILAPPNDLDSLKRGDPPKIKHQLDQGDTVNPSTAFTTAVMQLGFRTQGGKLAEGLTESDLKELVNLSLPFDRTLGIPLDVAADDLSLKFFQDYYGSDKTPHPELDWRRIDTDWLGSVGSIALDLDSDINNTSLVLAIEIMPKREVLLFAADAQFGNWKSWTESVKGKDLLRRTIFYKVGHHGSHNATQLDGGLLSMNPDELVAMIPVDIAKAKRKKWAMPAPILHQLLQKQTKGRIITNIEEPKDSDVDPSSPFKKPDFPDGNLISKTDWDKFIGAIRYDDSPDALWVEFNLQY